MSTTTEMPMPFIFTDNAASKVKSLIDEEGNPDLKLRVLLPVEGVLVFSMGLPSMTRSMKTIRRWKRTA